MSDWVYSAEPGMRVLFLTLREVRSWSRVFCRFVELRQVCRVWTRPVKDAIQSNRMPTGVTALNQYWISYNFWTAILYKYVPSKRTPFFLHGQYSRASPVSVRYAAVIDLTRQGRTIMCTLHWQFCLALDRPDLMFSACSSDRSFNVGYSENVGRALSIFHCSAYNQILYPVPSSPILRTEYLSTNISIRFQSGSSSWLVSVVPFSVC